MSKNTPSVTSNFGSLRVLVAQRKNVSLYRESLAEMSQSDTWLPMPVSECLPPIPPPPPVQSNYYDMHNSGQPYFRGNHHLLPNDAFPGNIIPSGPRFSNELSHDLPVSATFTPTGLNQPTQPTSSAVVPKNSTLTSSSCVRSEQGKPSVVKASKTKTKQRREKSTVNGRKIRELMGQHGTQNVYFGRGEPVRDNPGNVRFRRILDKYYGEYLRASKKVKVDIKNKIEREVQSDGSKFIVIIENSGDFNLESATAVKIKDATGHALRDTHRRRAAYWSWSDPSQPQIIWTTFKNKDGAALEQMFAEAMHLRTPVTVDVRREQHLVDVSSMTMRRASQNDSSDDTMFRVRRVEPDEGSESEEQVYVTDSDGQYDASSSAKSSASQGSAGTSGSSSTSSRPSGGAPLVQSSLYCTLGMSHKSREEITLSAYEAEHEEILELITSALEREGAEEAGKAPLSPTPDVLSASSTHSTTSPTRRNTRLEQDDDDDDNVSALQPPIRRTDPTATDGGSGVGGFRPGLVNRLKNVRFGSRPLPHGKKNESTDREVQSRTGFWVWRENKTRMDRHTTDMIEGDPRDCWVRYDETSSAVLEAAYRAQNGIGECKANSKYTVDFGLMRQTNTLTGFQRQVRRIESISFEKPDQEEYIQPKGSIGDTEKLVGKLRTMRVQDIDEMTLGDQTVATSTDDSVSLDLHGEMIFHRQGDAF